MTIGNYLKRQLEYALAMLDEEVGRLCIPERGDRNILIPHEALILNSIMLIKNVMGLVLFEKNREMLSNLYSCNIGRYDAQDPLTEFDDVPVKSIKVVCFGEITTAPTLTTKYGDIILALNPEVVLMIYQQLGATVDMRPKNPSESDTGPDNIIHADFGKKH